MNQQTTLPPEQEQAGMYGGGDASLVAQVGVAHTSAMARERYEIEGQMTFALQRPRQEMTCSSRILTMCERPGFAMEALYEFPRGGSTVEGLTVDFAREAMRAWGNMVAGWRVVEMTNDTITVKGAACDLETNTWRYEETQFSRMIQRRPKGGGKAKWVRIDDQRELLELCARNGAKMERNCVLKLIPADVREEAFVKIKTMRKKIAAGELKGEANRDKTLRAIVSAFGGLGVSEDMLMQHVAGDNFKLVTPDELDKLRAIGKSIKDGETRVADHFKQAEEEPAAEKPKADDATPKTKPADVKPAAPRAETATADEMAALRKAYEASSLDARGFVQFCKEQHPKLKPSRASMASMLAAIGKGLSGAQVRELAASLPPREARPADDQAPAAETVDERGGGITSGQMERLKAMVEDGEVTADDMKELIQTLFGTEKVMALDDKQAQELIDGIDDSSIWERLEGEKE